MNVIVIKLSSPPKIPYGFILLIINGNIILSALIFLVYLLAPLFGGLFSFNALLAYGSLSLMFVMLRDFTINLKRGRLVGKNKLLFLFVTECLVLLIWIEFSYALLAIVIFASVNIISYRFLLKKYGPLSFNGNNYG